MMDALLISGGVLGAVLLYYGADFLVSGGVALAERCRVPKLLIGLTLVAFGTSAPELVVSIDAALKNSGDIAAGNVIGSNICNIALILGVSACIAPLGVSRFLFKVDMPILAFATLLFAGIEFFFKGVSRWSAALLLMVFIVYLTVRIAISPGEFVEAAESEKDEKPKSVWLALLLTAAGLAALVGGAKLFVNGAVVLARLAGISEAVIALTIVALGTSLPELATSAVAAWKRETEIAVGNVVGSNLFNILLIMSIAPLVRPFATPGILTADLAAMCALVGVLYLMMTRKRQLGRFDGVILLLLYAGYVTVLAMR
ncbi:MAG: calcium/sodium antiporter [Victivallaceae bacterium]|nr:calcium/sodium antiporter [Victivallaceae bacterium]